MPEEVLPSLAQKNEVFFPIYTNFCPIRLDCILPQTIDLVTHTQHVRTVNMGFLILQLPITENMIPFILIYGILTTVNCRRMSLCL